MKNNLKSSNIQVLTTVEQKSIAGGSGGLVTSTEKAIDPVLIPTKPID